MYNKYIAVLLVDDDADILMVSKLALKNVTVFGLPLKIYTAASKAEAIHLLQTNLASQAGLSIISVALIDVVMENDQAGLELCHYLREERQEMAMTLYIRTGQPGLAPERAVIDLYNINGYFTKVETTDNKLYSMVKSGTRQALLASYTHQAFNAIEALSLVSYSRAAMIEALSQIGPAWGQDGAGQTADFIQVRHAFSVNKEWLVNQTGLNAAELATLHTELELAPAWPKTGPHFKITAIQNHLLIKAEATSTAAEVVYIGLGNVPFPDEFAYLLARPVKCLANLWTMAA